jgi:hypothetical protein
MLAKPFMISFLLIAFTTVTTFGQPDRWQQRAEYKMTIDFDVNSHQFTGTQQLRYFNNSPDTLHRVFYHLYFNAFQPGSMMDVRSNQLSDADPRVGGRITKLKPDEIGFHRVVRLTQNGAPLEYEMAGTILEVNLVQPILPGTSAFFEMQFESQVPIQIRRSGRDNSEGISYSMSQWYPKMCEYDYQGWHANPYVGREFYGIWGDFDVTIKIDPDYILGATGYLQAPETIGYYYEPAGTEVTKSRDEKLSWRFIAPNVHDFVWAADPDYKHTVFTRENGMQMHFLYQENEDTRENWSRLPNIMDRVFDYLNEHYGEYPYEQYSFIQAGDGGMEYPMATLITGERGLGSLVGVSVHELVHSWYQGVLGTNEALYAWMDEGFTSYVSGEVMNWLREENLIPGKPTDNPYAQTLVGYSNLVRSGVEEPLTVHADHFMTNYGYGMAAYTKGSVFLNQLKYIVGEEDFQRGMLRYYDEWKFKHPNTNDFIRIMEKTSGLELDWFKEYFVHTTHTIDYGVASATPADGGGTLVTLEKIGYMPMPVDLAVEMKDGTMFYYTIPLRIMRGAKAADGDISYTVLPDWPWTNPGYEVVLPHKPSKVARITINPLQRMADLESNNDEVKMQKEKPKKRDK